MRKISLWDLIICHQQVVLHLQFVCFAPNRKLSWSCNKKSILCGRGCYTPWILLICHCLGGGDDENDDDHDDDGGKNKEVKPSQKGKRRGEKSGFSYKRRRFFTFPSYSFTPSLNSFLMAWHGIRKNRG